jgi:hemolysin activation/secretion protein
VARLQSAGDRISIFGRLSAQWANRNLDSSEDFGLGGPNGVRAYPPGEGFGDEGKLAQLELRYRMNDVLAPYLFADAGSARINVFDWQGSGDTQRRNISGAGLGARAETASWSADASVSWRNRGGTPQSDSRDDKPQYWLTATYRF